MSKEQVVKGSPCESSAGALGFEVIEPEHAEVTITITSSVRQIGKTSIAKNIEKALADVGYKNVCVVHENKSEKQSYENTVLFTKNNNPNLRIKLVDRHQKM